MSVDREGSGSAQGAPSGAVAEPERMGYASRIPGCGCVVAVQVDDPKYKRDTAKFLAAEARQGFVLERHPVEFIRSLPWGWPCEHMKAAGTTGLSDGQLVLTTGVSDASGKELP